MWTNRVGSVGKDVWGMCHQSKEKKWSKECLFERNGIGYLGSKSIEFGSIFCVIETIATNWKCNSSGFWKFLSENIQWFWDGKKKILFSNWKILKTEKWFIDYLLIR